MVEFDIAPLNRRQVAKARQLAEIAAAENDTRLSDELVNQARLLGYRNWTQLMTAFKEKHP